MNTLCFAVFAASNLIFAAVKVEARPRLAPLQSQRRKLDSTHFTLIYDARRLSQKQAIEAQSLVEAGWNRCAGLFGQSAVEAEFPLPLHKIQLDLTPSFIGFTGRTFTRYLISQSQSVRSAKGSKKIVKPVERKYQPAAIAVRYAELDYLGLRADYVLTHEIGHVFSGSLYRQAAVEGIGATSLGEGIADWAAGSFGGLPLRPWWGKTLRKTGLWIAPDAFFISGNYHDRPGIDARDLTARYTESALLVQFLVSRFGWPKFHAFALDYSRQRGALDSNESRRRFAQRYKFQWRSKSRDPRQAPDAKSVEATFLQHFGVPWPQLRTEWATEMEEELAPPQQAEQLVLARETYAAIRDYEMWLAGLAQPPAPATHAAIRAAFVRCNSALNKQQTASASRYLQQANRLVKQLRQIRQHKNDGLAKGKGSKRIQSSHRCAY